MQVIISSYKWIIDSYKRRQPRSRPPEICYP